MIEEHPKYYIHNEAALLTTISDIRLRASQMGFVDPKLSRILTSVSELGNNILKYAVRGRVDLRVVSEGVKKGLEISVVDWGPGISDIKKAMQEQFSSSGTLGLGLPGVRRMVDEFHIESKHLKGTLIRVIIWK